MFGHRLSCNAARIALFAVLLSALPPAGAHGRGRALGFDGHSDFCSTIGAKGPAPASPLPADRGHKVCNHCDGCTGNAGNAWAPPSPVAPAILLGATPPSRIHFSLPAVTPVELIAAPPRGPPSLA
jgi:hypothetical protein